jgi:hypothetical protein
MQLSPDTLLRALQALKYYQENQTGDSEEIWDRYENAIKEVERYRENYSTN